MKILQIVFWSFLFSALALILSDQVLYRLWLAPQLSSPQYIPSYYFLLVFLPLLLLIISFGLVLSSWKHVCLVAFVFTLSHQLYDNISAVVGSPGYLTNYSLEQPYNFWLLRSFLIFCVYLIALSILWCIKIILLKTAARHASKLQSGKKNTETAAETIKKEDRIPARIIYHVVPFKNNWLVKKGRAKKASSSHSTKKDALQAASEVAKSHPQSQVVVHNASGIIESDRIYEYRHYKKKRKKKEISRKIKKGLKRNKRKELEQRLRRRKAARLGIARVKRRKYLRRQTAKKAARKRKK